MFYLSNIEPSWNEYTLYASPQDSSYVTWFYSSFFVEFSGFKSHVWKIKKNIPAYPYIFLTNSGILWKQSLTDWYHKSFVSTKELSQAIASTMRLLALLLSSFDGK